MAAEHERLEIAPERAVEVRETHTLFRLAPAADNDLGRSSRQIAIVAADTEEEARQIASMHDAFGRDWRDPRFALCEPWTRRRPTCSAMSSFGPSRL